MRWLIIGGVNTPYYLAPFFFDLLLPSQYPQTPPVLHYNSVLQQKLNPSLHEDGKVCRTLAPNSIVKSPSLTLFAVGLLGTQTGHGKEVWNPLRSNLLQLALAIQSVILGTSEPYFLEPGYVMLLL